MVSIRRRKNLGISSGVDYSSIQFPKWNANVNVSKAPIKRTISVTSLDESPSKKSILKPSPASADVSASSSSKEEPDQQLPVQGIKRRKLHRRKNFSENGAYCLRGVYYKNMKWQAAIKVDKKQIHLGTLPTKEDAAHLYDRAAFMCGRAPNFDLPEEEKQELRRYNWTEFLTMTRSSIACKKVKRDSNEEESRKKPWLSLLPSSNGEQGVDGFSALADVNVQAPVS
ncbi:hypothetical protein MKW94_026832 [Papaver nudicaule]|uniref:AP2/ERF domain-containing protein n=1 Tax=Papaver nudicaule TaxID=74823 RepID=A0AA41VJC6_PAPNU|nr:hypothetical protein [Papaver nudicaule]